MLHRLSLRRPKLYGLLKWGIIVLLVSVAASLWVVVVPRAWNNAHLAASQQTPVVTVLPTGVASSRRTTTPTLVRPTVSRTNPPLPSPAPPSSSTVHTPPPAPPPSITRFAPLTDAQYEVDRHCGLTGGGVILTFDDWGTPEHIRAIADLLTSYHVGAIFFPIQSQAVNYPEVLTYLHDHGFYVGNHSVTHPLDPPLTKLSDVAVRAEIAGGVPSNLFRPPGNYFDGRIQHIATSLGYQLCSYTVDTRDYTGLPAKAIVKEVLADTQPNGVVLMHLLGNSHALAALPGIIKGLRTKGFRLCQATGRPTGTNIPNPLTC